MWTAYAPSADCVGGFIESAFGIIEASLILVRRLHTSMSHPCAAFTVILTVGACVALPAQDRWTQADLQTRRLPPSLFPQLPPALRRDLERRGCTIPQVWSDTVPGNVVSGRFRDSSQVDWAVLCSIHRQSSILVFWAGQTDSVAVLDSAPDDGYLQTVGGGQIGYSRGIDVADTGYIRQHYQWYGGPEPPPLDHEGIENAFVGKASGIWYWYQGKWLLLQGAD